MSHRLSRRLRTPVRRCSEVAHAGAGLFEPFRCRYHAGELLGGALLLGELGVLAIAPPAGALLLGSTVGLGGVAVRGLRRMQATAESDRRTAASDALLIDSESGLPSRPHLIDQLSREIARAQRYNHDMSIVVIGVAQFEGLRTCWGSQVATSAAVHVAHTLRRITRSSDFLARIDESHFAVVLMQCNAAQAAIFGERVSLAVSNRPLTTGDRGRVPLYVCVETAPLQYHPARYRGPLDFLSAAGGEVSSPAAPRRQPAASESLGGGWQVVRPEAAPALPAFRFKPRSSPLASDPRALRRQLMRDYYPEGKAADFADAYRAQRSGTKRAV